MNESEKQFSFTRAAPSTSGHAKNQIPVSNNMNDSRTRDSSEALKQDTNRGEPADAKAAYDAKLAKDIKEDPAKFNSEFNRAKALAAEAQHKDASPKTAPAPESETQGRDNDYYNGMSQ